MPSTARRATLIGELDSISTLDSQPIQSGLKLNKAQSMIDLKSNSMSSLYIPGDVIGNGSFGVIRKVTRKSDGLILARKELNYGRMDERDLKQLTEEVNILEKLGNNDNIVGYYERYVDKPNNMLYILMEYCPSGDLAGLIQRTRKAGFVFIIISTIMILTSGWIDRAIISEDVVWAYLAQLTLALYDCHSETDQNGQRKPVILHRDIKPENGKSVVCLSAYLLYEDELIHLSIYSLPR